VVTRVKRDITESLNEKTLRHDIDEMNKSYNSYKRTGAKHKYIEMAIVADNYVISGIGEKLIPHHLMMLVHLVSKILT
jgi:hypothetical protein